MERIAIVGAKRTAIGRFGGQFQKLSAVELGVACLTGLLAEIKDAALQVEQVYLGNVLSAGLGQNPARQVAIKSGLTAHVTATTVNDVCGSSLRALRFAQQSLLLGDAEVVVAGGIESMSQAPLLLPRPAKRQPINRTADLTDSLFNDGLIDSLTHEAMGNQVEELVIKRDISRLAQDEFALKSQQKASLAQANHIFDHEIVPIIQDNLLIATDEAVRNESTLAGLAALKPAFRTDGTITAGNASPLNDGASMVLLTTASYAQQHNWPILGFLEEFSEVGRPSPEFGLTPIDAVQSVLMKAQLTVDQVGLFEVNEAFAAQTLAVQEALRLPSNRVNIYGGAIALGHPLAATGTRLITTLLTGMKERHVQHGIATLCIGGGQGIAYHLSREGLDN